MGMRRSLQTAHHWSVELSEPYKSLQTALDGRTPDSTRKRGRSVQSLWYLTTVLDALGGSTEELDGNAERARKDKEAADKLALENAKTRGELGVLTEIAAWFRGHVERARARLIQIPDALGQFCDPRTATIVVAECRRLVHEALAELAAERAEGGAADSAGMDTAADIDGERMGGSQSSPVKRGQRRAGTVAN